jgi:hypothetical protein
MPPTTEDEEAELADLLAIDVNSIINQRAEEQEARYVGRVCVCVCCVI